MEGDDIKKLLAQGGISQAEIARKLGISKVFVNKVIYNRTRSTKRVRQAIADVVGKSVEEIWGNTMTIPRGPFSDLTSNPILSAFELTDREGFFSTREMGNTELKEMFIPLLNFIPFLPCKSPPFFGGGGVIWLPFLNKISSLPNL